MASAALRPGKRRHPVAPDLFERILAAGAVLLLAAVALALAKGFGEWRLIPAVVWLHLATVIVALLLTPVMLLRPRGDRLHRTLGWFWAGAMTGTALISFEIRDSDDGSFSWIHLLSVWTLIQVPVIVWAARAHNHKRHRASVRGMVTGALLIAGFFTFPFDRLLGHWLFS